MCSFHSSPSKMETHCIKPCWRSHLHLLAPNILIWGVKGQVDPNCFYILSFYLIYIAPLHRFLHHIRSTLFTCARPFSVSFLCEKEPPPLRSTLRGAYRCHGSCVHISASARQPGETQCFCIHFIAPPTILQSGRNMVVGHVPMIHTCSFMCTNHIDMIAYTPAFYEFGSTPVIQTSIMQAEDGWHFFILFSKTF